MRKKLSTRGETPVLIIIAGCVLTMSGCMVGPDYCRSNISMNENYLEASDSSSSDTTASVNGDSESDDSESGVETVKDADISMWWDQFQDPTLRNLIEKGLSDNLTLQQYAARVWAARANIGITRSNLFPQFTENGSYNYQYLQKQSIESWSLGTGMSWELDFFGRLERLTEAAQASMRQQNELYKQAYLIIVADIAQNYVNARAYQQQIIIARRNIEIRKKTYDLTQGKSQVGTSSRLDISQALGSYKGVQADIWTLETGYQKTLNSLSILTGENPGAVDAMMSEVKPIPAAPEKILVSIPADLLRQRPDVVAAEESVIAQTARIGAAIGELYPMFSLTGSFGLEAADIGKLFDSDSIVAGVGPSFRWNILNFGRYRDNVELQRITTAEYWAAYRQTVLEAAKEVDDTLVGYVKEKKRLVDLTAAVSAYKESMSIAQQRYSDGTADLQRVLDSQTGLLTYELQQAQSQASLANYTITLYRALGGSWTQAQPQTPENTPIP